jgi:hypothetical protein
MLRQKAMICPRGPKSKICGPQRGDEALIKLMF